MLVGWGLRMVSYYFRVSQNCNVVLLVELKHAPGVVDGDGDAGQKWDLLPIVGSWLVFPLFLEFLLNKGWGSGGGGMLALVMCLG